MAINKSIFLEGLICPLKGWYLYNKFPIQINEWRLKQGKAIGEMARNLFPEGILIEGFGQQAIDNTHFHLNNSDASILFEAAFNSDYFSTRADILICEESGWHLVEVKSSTDYSLKSKEKQQKYINDVAYTLMVMNDSILVKKISIMTLSKKFKLGMDLQDLFIITDITTAIFERKNELIQMGGKLSEQILSANPPNPQWVFACKTCDFFKSTCLGKKINNPIFNLPNIKENKCLELINAGLYEINDIPESFKLSSKQTIVRNATLFNKPEMYGDLKKYLSEIKWPVYYLDFETITTAFPLYPEVTPYEQILTQYSLHKLDSKDSNLVHMEYLADLKLDCRFDLLNDLLYNIKGCGSIIVYSSFEKARLSALKEKFPELKHKLCSILDRIVDLMSIIQNTYYHPGFMGSYSIKNVLPVLVPNLNYSDLIIKNGDEAISVFAKMAIEDLSDEEMFIQRTNLLEYCCRDTLAMVELHKYLLNIT